MISINNGKGFHLTFENGLTISVQIGYGNYCENYNINNTLQDGTTPRKMKCKNAEIGIWDEHGNWVTRDFIKDLDDDVVGYIVADEIADLINKVKNAEKKTVYVSKEEK
jgi:hypothetical protein